MPPPGLRDLASKVLSPVGTAVRAIAEAASWRRVWTSAGRTHIELRGVHEPGSEEAARDVRQRLLDLDGVKSAEVNAHFGRVVVAHDRDVIDENALVAVVAEAEREWGLRTQAPAGASHPANAAPAVREAVALGISLFGAGYALVGRVLPVRALPPALPALISLVDSAPRWRGAVERSLGRPATDLVLAWGSSTGNTLARNPIALLTDAGYRALMRREVAARQAAWRRWEERTADRAGIHESGPVPRLSPRSPLPPGPVERLGDLSAPVALAGFGTVYAASRSLRRASTVLLAGVPRAAKVGRDAFAGQVDVDFSRAGSLVLEPDALRRMDRVDTVVLDSALLLTGGYVLDSVIVLDGFDGEVDEVRLAQLAHDLVDPFRPRDRRDNGEWAIASPTAVRDTLPVDMRSRVAALRGPGAVPLVALRGAEPVGLVRMLSELDPRADALVAAARRAGTVVVAGLRSRLDARLDVERTVAGGTRLARSVRRLQEEGRVVAVVSDRARSALHAADVGIGVRGERGEVPWGADVACPDIGQACLLLDAAPVATRTSRDVARLSLAGSSLGALLGALGPATGATTRAAFPVQMAAALAMGLGTWRGVTVARRPVPVPVDRTPWHEMSPDAVLRRLSTSSAGLAEEDSKLRHGPPAEAAELDGTGLAMASMEELANPMTPALAAGAGISATVGSIADAVMITGVLGFNALIGGMQRVGATRELRRLLDTSAVRVRLRRAGTLREARADELVPGDVIEFRAGDAVPADCRILEAHGLEMDESSLTGESQLVRKSVPAISASVVADRSSMLYEGTAVAAGRGLGIVVATGDLTEAGRGVKTEGEPPKTGVEERLRELTGRALPVSLGAGGLLMGLDLFRGRGLSQSLGRAVSLAVAAVPEGLPIVATVAELASARRLSRQGVIVRGAATIEALGRVDVLCFDKTGTLTEGRIGLRRVSDGETDEEVSALTPALRAVLAAAVRASPWHEDGELPHPTDRAVLTGAHAQEVTATDGLGQLDWVAELAFEPARGYHAALARRPGGYLLSVKGAPEVVLARCVRWRRPDGHVPMDAEAMARVDAEVDRLARAGYRVLAVAERDASGRAELDDARIQRLDLVGLVALADPVRGTAAASVDELKRAGVDVVMITGDHPSTAASIAAELGMIDGGRVMTGDEIDALDDDGLVEALPGIGVFARVSPAQKARLVRQLRRSGKVVAMTGDGANDAPAIRLAHVGIALGSGATAAARGAADLVVTDNRIETITAALVEGRSMWTSVREAVAILVGGNLGEIAFTVGSGLLSSGETLNARQLLLVNLLTDVLPALAVAVRPPPHVTPEELLSQGPEASLGSALMADIYRRATITGGATGAGWLLARPVSSPAQASTTALVTLVGGQLGQTVAVRGRTPLVIGAGVGSAALLAAVVQTPGLSHFFGCRPLLPHQWAIAAGSSAAATAAELAWQLWPHGGRA
ncbi:MAG TPA: cation-translocating P-type ATPase [Amycolatopsis sp.]|nr:cation-translocating P-type ATPase [Amycolatopsis sp.]